MVDTNQLSVKELIDTCQECCTSFNPAQLSLDAHADAFLSARSVTAEADCAFIRQVLYGTARFHALLKSFVDSFYRKHSGSVLRGDAQLYKIFAYLAITRLTELGIEQYRRIVSVADPQKMMVLLEFIIDTDGLVERCRDEWLRIYDKEYVDELLATLVSFRPELEDLLQQLQDQVHLTAQASEAEAAKFTGTTKAASAARKQTVPEPFNLTQPKPKLQPLEEPLPAPVKCHPAPTPHQGPTKEERAIEAAKQRNRQQQLQRFSDPAHGPFHLLTAERPTNTQQLKQQQEEELAKQLTLYPGKPRPAPGPPAAQVRLNAAAILREDTVYKKKQLQEAQMIKRFEAELRDSSKHDSCQREAVAADLAARAAAVRQRRDDMAATQEAAIRARQQLVQQNLQAGQQLKVEAEREANRRQRDKIQAEKAKGVPRKGKEFDPAESGGHNLLEEMSLLELRQRLAYTKQRHLEEEEQQRAEIFEKKKEKEGMLARKAANITSIRRIAAAQATARRQLTKQQQAAAAQQVRSWHQKPQGNATNQLFAMPQTSSEEKRIKFEQQQQGAAASQVEETSFASLVAGQARELVQRQRSTKQDAVQYEATKAKANTVRMKSVKQDLKAKADFIKAYDESMQQLRGTDQQFRQQELMRKKCLVESQHDFEARLLQTHKEKAYVPGSTTEGPAAALLKQLSLGVLASEASLSVKQ
ncbi:MAG: hypothetical protein FRX49_07926 [Trebouxia sp. A1-2]|nr:MAG: hypothetical protein FRX49_07926 [Trebouxia sp. A1-2]